MKRMANQLTIDMFIDELADHFGVYENKKHIAVIRRYIEKYIDETKLNQVIWFVMLYYKDKKYPPITGDIDGAIRQAVKDNRGNDPFKKTAYGNEYDYTLNKITDPIQKEKLKEMFGGLAKDLKVGAIKKELNKTNNVDNTDDDIFHKNNR